jgi:site-specific recombinase XerD
MFKMSKPILSESTIKTYEHTLKLWYAFTNTNQKHRWSPGRLERTVIKYIDFLDRQGISPTTARREICALQWRFGDRVKCKKVKARLLLFEHRKGRPPNRATPIDVDDLKLFCTHTRLQRDRTILAVGWAGALRASELCVIKRNDLVKTPDGYELTIPRSKTDQRGRGRIIPLPYYNLSHMIICPARNLDTFLMRQAELFDELPKDDFLWPITTRTVARIISRAAKAACYPDKYSTHSLRRGMATTAAKNNIDDRTIMRHGRWTTRESVDTYVDAGTLWSRTALDFLR